jgi:hypothetical protein
MMTLSQEEGGVPDRYKPGVETAMFYDLWTSNFFITITDGEPLLRFS